MKTFLLGTNPITSREISIELLDHANLTIVVKKVQTALQKHMDPNYGKFSTANP